jgi:succinyl-diaminopimelate desuccinylase
VALLFVADEETGSDLGLTWLLKHQAKLFRKNDLIVVPDGGDAKGEKLEVAEKTILWIRFTVTGKQCHGSMPYLGTNAARAAAQLTVLLDTQLHKRFPARDALFMPPESTFEPTKHEANVPNVNTIPGTEIFHFDCRVLPRYKSVDVLKVVQSCIRKVEKATRVKIRYDLLQHAPAAPPTPPQAEIVRRLTLALKDLRPRLRPTVWGVGGGTVAAIFRRHGFPAVVWSTYDELAHAPNEYAVVKNLIADAKVYAHLFTQPRTLPKP